MHTYNLRHGGWKQQDQKSKVSVSYIGLHRSWPDCDVDICDAVRLRGERREGVEGRERKKRGEDGRENPCNQNNYIGRQTPPTPVFKFNDHNTRLNSHAMFSTTH